MTGNAGTKAAKAAGHAYEANRARAKKTRDLRASWVLDSEWTAEEHLEVQRTLKRECAQREGRAA